MNSGSSASIGSGGQSLATPAISPRDTRHRGLRPRRSAAGALDTTMTFDVGAVLQRLVDIGFQRHARPPRRPSSAVITSRQSQSRCGPSALRREAAEDDGVDGADAGAGQHGDGGSGIIGM
jgi:hypothetical protein